MDTISRTTLLGASALALLAVIGISAPNAAHAQDDCARGDLDDRFCDTDGDLLADAPTDEADFVDPSTLIFTYTPVEDPALYREVWDEFTAHLAEVTGRDVTYFTVNSYAAMVEAMRAGRLHIGGFSTGSVPLGVNCAGFHPRYTMGTDGVISGYEMEIITYPGSGIEEVDDLIGQTLAFTNPASNSGYRAPSALLSAEFGINVEEDLETTFSGAHDQSILGVANQDYPAAAVANSVMGRMLDRDVVSEDQIVTIYQSETFPTTSYGYVNDLHPDLKADIDEAFQTFPWEGALAEEFSDSDGFVEISYEDDWRIIRTIANEIGEVFECS
ncbi:phosphate/phosphite/phosphonate ABC transporter substrate-binding protein [Fodinicurvata sp. EGI_FJ10296]|uniref:phosphate/phosphite/phosphonate ABC transporter substrate-binding protein n=1 Tax=Fodinicurvata sp. EGI_FJ10296 TaxID=3231908 RepID=UPI0034520F80